MSLRISRQESLGKTNRLSMRKQSSQSERDVSKSFANKRNSAQNASMNESQNPTATSKVTKKLRKMFTNEIGKPVIEEDSLIDKNKFLQTLIKHCQDQEDQIESKRNANLIDRYNNQDVKAKSYIQDLTLELELEQLYKIIGSCNYNNFNKWCPVLLQTGQHLREALLEKNQRCPNYLLQVWDEKAHCVFERDLKAIIMNWMIKDDIFVWEEQNENENSFNNTSSFSGTGQGGEKQTKFFMLKLYEDKEPIFLQMNVTAIVDTQLQEKRSSKKVNSSIFMRICVLENHLFFIRDKQVLFFDIATKLAELESLPAAETRFKQHCYEVPKSEIFSFSSQHRIVNFCDLGTDGVCMTIEKSSVCKTDTTKGVDFVTKFVKMTLEDPQKLTGSQHLVLNDKLNSAQKKLTLKTLGTSDHTSTRVSEIKLVIEKDDDGSQYCVGVALHQENIAVFFYNYNEVNRSDLETVLISNVVVSNEKFVFKVHKRLGPQKYKQREKMDLSQFKSYEKMNTTIYQRNKQAELKAQNNRVQQEAQVKFCERRGSQRHHFIHDEEDFNEVPDMEIDLDGDGRTYEMTPRILQCDFSWKNKISISSCFQMNPSSREYAKKMWLNLWHSRLSKQFNLFKDFLPLQTYFLISHRNFVSTYNLARMKWDNIFIFDDIIQDICLGELSSPQSDENNTISGSSLTDKLAKAYSEKFAPYFKTINLEEDKSKHPVIFTKEDSFCINIVVGNDISKITSLKYFKTRDVIDMLPQDKKFQSFLLEADYKDCSIITTANDEWFNRGLFMLICDTPSWELRRRVPQSEGSKYSNYFYVNPPQSCADCPVPKTQLVCYSRNEIEVVVDQSLISNCTFMRQRDSHDVFKITPECQICVYIGADADKKEEDLDREIEKRNIVTQVMLSNNQAHRSIIISLIDDKNENTRNYQIEEMEFLHPEFVDDDEEDELIGCCVVHGQSYGDNRYSLIRITKKSISIYDKDGDLKISYLNFKILAMNYVDDAFLYCILENSFDAIVSSTLQKIDRQMEDTIVDENKRKRGLYMFDLAQLINSKKFEAYRIAGSNTGVSAKITNGNSLEKFCYLPDFSTVNVMPYMHRNSFNFYGMSVKQEYLIWRETSTQFTALHRSGMLQIWCICSGKLLYYTFKPEYQDYQDYMVYAANKDDKSYIQKLGQQEKRSISLIKKIQPEPIEALKKLMISSKNSKSKKQPAFQDDTDLEENAAANSCLLCFCESKNKKSQEAEVTSSRFNMFELIGDIVDNTQNNFKCVEGNVQIKVFEEEDDFETYNFKVLQLRSSLDQEAIFLKDKKKFEFRAADELIELFNFDFNLKKNQNQKLYLSQDCKRLLAIEMQTEAVIYKIKRNSDAEYRAILSKLKMEFRKKKMNDPKEVQPGQKSMKIEWEENIRIRQFPSMLQGQASVNFLFSPDFKYMIDINYSEKRFMISKLKRNVHKGKVRGSHSICDFKIDKGWLPMDSTDQSNTAEILLSISKRISWAGQEHLSFISDSGVSCYVKFVDEVRNYAKRYRLGIKSKNLTMIPPQCYDFLNTGCCSEITDAQWNKIKKNVKKLVDQKYKNLIHDHHESRQKSLFEIQSYIKIDNFKISDLEKFHHYSLEPKPTSKKNVFTRLVRSLQKQKITQEHYKDKAKWYEKDPYADDSTQLIDFSEEAAYYKESEKQNVILNNLFAVDYTGSVESDENLCGDYFATQISFTVIDWLSLENILENSNSNLNELDKMQRLQLCFNVFPRGMGILHTLATNKQKDELRNPSDSVNQIERYNRVVADLFKAAQEGLEFDLGAYQAKEPFEIPLLENLQGNTVIDLALCIQDEENQNEFNIQDDSMNTNLNLSLAALVFANIKDYSIWHSGPMLKEAVIEAIKKDIPGIGEYLSARLIKTESFIKPMQKKMRSSHTLTDLFCYNVCNVEVIQEEQNITNQLFSEGTSETTQRIEQQIFDIPCLDQSCKSGAAFINALYQLPYVDKPNPIFGERVVHIILQKQWATCWYQYMLVILIPFLCNLGVFYYWSTVQLDNADQGGINSMQTYVLTWVVIAFSAYFLLIELAQLVGNPIRYLQNTTEQLIDIIPPVLIIVNGGRVIYNTNTPATLVSELTIPDENGVEQSYKLTSRYILNDNFWVLQAIISLTIWFKLFNLFKINARTAYLIQMITACIVMIVPFLVILGITVLAFGSAFIMMTNSNNGNETIIKLRDIIVNNPTFLEQDQFINLNSEVKKILLGDNFLGSFVIGKFWSSLSFTVQIILGNYDQIDKFDGWTWALFILAAIFLQILLLNLIIAIISTVYDQKTEFKDMNYYLSLTSRIYEINMIKRWFISGDENKNQFMFVVSPADANNPNFEEALDPQEKLQQTTQNILKIVSDLYYWAEQNKEEDQKAKIAREKSKALEKIENKYFEEDEDLSEFQKIMAMLQAIWMSLCANSGQKGIQEGCEVCEDQAVVEGKETFWQKEIVKRGKNSQRNGHDLPSIAEVYVQNNESESITFQNIQQQMTSKLDKKNGKDAAKTGKQVNFFDDSREEMQNIVDNVDNQAQEIPRRNFWRSELQKKDKKDN